MDLYLNSTIDDCNNILETLGFEIIDKGGYRDAILKDGWNRYHIYFVQDKDQVYCDFHYDKFLHIMFFGVDYGKQPTNFFINFIQPALDTSGIASRAKTSNWFHRRNKAVFTGFRLR